MKELLDWLEKKYQYESDLIEQYIAHTREHHLSIPTELIHAEVRLNAYYRVIQKIKTMERNKR